MSTVARYTTSQILAITSEDPVTPETLRAGQLTLATRRNRGILHLGSKALKEDGSEARDFTFTFAEAVAMVLVKHLTGDPRNHGGFLDLATAHHIAEDDNLRSVIENMDQGDLERLHIKLIIGKRANGRIESFLIAGRKNGNPAHVWAGLIEKVGNHTRHLGLGTWKAPYDPDLLPAVLLTVDMRQLADEVEAALHPRKKK